MIQSLTLIILVAAFFAAAVLNLALQSRVRGTVMALALGLGVTIGAVYYGFGYAWTYGLNVTSLVRAVLALCRMFGGVNDLGSIQGSPMLQKSTGTAVFWIGHFCAFYVTASAAIATLGERLLQKIRVTLLRFGPLLLIYGVNDSSVAYGRSMAKNKRRSVMFVDPDAGTSYESTIHSFGAIIDRSSAAVTPDKTLLRKINMKAGSRRLELAAFHTDGRRNLDYAKKLLQIMTDAHITPDQTSLVASGIGEESASLQALDGPGYGSVLTFDDYDLTSRLIIRDYPPCSLISFDAYGRAENSFHVVILGFGRMGRALFSELLCNGQFSGSTFRADIFDPSPQNGYLHRRELTRNYDLHFHTQDGRIDDFYEFLQENMRTIRCIAVCTGNAENNHEIAQDLSGWYGHADNAPLIVEAVRGSYACTQPDGTSAECRNIYDSDILDISRIDAMAMQINHMYNEGSPFTAPQDWEKCGYFSRMSSRASADFYPAVLRAAEKTAQQVLAGDWPPDDRTMENLAITEHLRWCAFHYVYGYAVMPREEFERRAAIYREEAERTGKSRVSLTRDQDKKLHACLIPWEELDALSDRVNAITGGQIDYKQLDRNNVLAVRDVLCAMQAADQ